MSELFVVGTPIGNLKDITYRAVETLKSVDFICAEDTRVTAKLLSHFDIKKPLVSYHEHSSGQTADSICSRILSGESAAIVTDAGMPCISDPGEKLVKRCYELGIKVTVVPGPVACASALALSGLDTRRFSFEGFLPVAKKERQPRLAKAARDENTLIFYEAPHKLITTLEDMLTYFGDRRISLCRELTKIHEEVFRTTLSQAIEHYKTTPPKGEFVLVIEGAKEQPQEGAATIDDALGQVEALVNNGMRAADACKEIAKVSPYSKGELYSKYLEVRK
ncbi:MAG: 16S rRNA (cytidine(1402)-2'-O)-methyltransferase [Ruminococcus sp.]|nr:16S rRNA (cytidine(1402)-2'-O)-methyltransferase [Ruminococcus sp.]